MTLEEVLVKRYLFYAHNMGIGKLNYFIYQQKRVAVRHYFFNMLYIKYRRLCRIVNRHIFYMLVLFNVLLDFFCKCHVAAMAWPVGNNPGLDRITDQCKVAHNIQ